ncbi:MAG TPA: signal peptidase I [Thermofilum sp.]|nr:signal peptidase I [Thermofilum sp.]
MSKKEIIYTLLLIALTVFIAFGMRPLLEAWLGTPVPLAVVSSWSMEPEFHVGDLLILAKSSTYKVGDIILFSRGGELIVHRIVAITSNGSYVTQGDANPSRDPLPVPPSKVYGKVVLVIPYVGAVRLLLAKILGF